jgi:hypothetical protein
MESWAFLYQEISRISTKLSAYRDYLIHIAIIHIRKSNSCLCERNINHSVIMFIISEPQAFCSLDLEISHLLNSVNKKKQAVCCDAYRIFM